MSRAERWIVIATILFAVLSWDWTTSNPGPCVPSEQQQADQGQKKRCEITKTVAVRSLFAVMDWIAERHAVVSAAATVVIAIFTITLWVATRGLLEAAKTDAAIAKQSAAAAMKAANVAAAADRPHLLLMGLQASGLLQPANTAGQVELTLTFRFQNFGKSPAFLNGHAFDLNWDMDLPSEPPYPSPIVLPHIVAPVTGTYFRPARGGVFIPKPIADEIAAGTRHLHFFGKLDYEDILDAPHVTRSCYRLVFQGKDASINFRPVGPASYWEYT